MNALHDDFRAMVAELEAKRPKAAAAVQRAPSPQAHAVSSQRDESYGRLRCCLCDGPADKFTCKRCDAGYERHGL